MKALVTGATGFVGSNIVRGLVREGWEVHAVVRSGSTTPRYPEFDGVQLHVCDGETDDVVQAVSLVRPDVVFHLASLFLALHKPGDISPLIRSNVLFGTQLLEAMVACGVARVVNTGTAWQHYGNSDYNPVNLYAATKEAFEAILDYYVQAHGLRAITLKLFDVYGPADPRPKIINLLRESAATGRLLELSSGDQYLDFVFIDDVVDAFELAASRLLGDEATGHSRYGIFSGERIRLRELVARFASVTGLTPNVKWGARPYRAREVMVPWSLGEQLPGWFPKWSLDRGLRALYS